MYSSWTVRVWDMYVDYYYAKIKINKHYKGWVKIASDRHYNNDGRWRGI